jgi:hypothetical protein
VGKGKGSAAVDQAVACHHALRRGVYPFHAEVMASVLHKNIIFLKGSRVEKKVNAFPRSQLAGAALLLNLFRAASQLDFLFFLQHFLEFCFLFHEINPFLATFVRHISSKTIWCFVIIRLI